jgi:dTDP-4-dehydrorhamnose 3,5-epimerase-like enzyme/dTDP-4-dehydrorhamnose reductase
MNNGFIDKRGKLIFTIKNKINNNSNSDNNLEDFKFTECTVSINKKNVFRGIHVNQFDKLITCVSGKILDIIVNFNETDADYLVPKYYLLDPATDIFQILVKKNYGHSFLSLEDNSVLLYHFNGNFKDEETKHIHYLDPFINIKLPVDSTHLILSDKDNIKNFVKNIDYIIFGSTGFLGSNIVEKLKLKNKNFIISSLRLQNINEISQFLDIYKPKYVINCAGLTGSPNIFWCDEHKIETIECNITYQLTLAKLCFDKGIHLTCFGSGGIFESDKFYSENEEGNYKKNFYSECRIYLESIIKHYSNVLYLRINYPISSRKSHKNLLTKLLTYKNIEQVDLSITCIDDLFIILFDMIENNENGICNFVNPGSIKLFEILEIYNKYNSTNPHIFTLDKINDTSENKRSYSRLKTTMLNKYNPKNIKDAVELCCKSYNDPIP